MHRFIWMTAMLLAILTSCKNTKEQGKHTARQLSGGQMADQEKVMKERLKKVEEQQKQRYKKLDDQMNQQRGQ